MPNFFGSVGSNVAKSRQRMAETRSMQKPTRMADLMHGKTPHRNDLAAGPIVALALGIIRIASHDVHKAATSRNQHPKARRQASEDARDAVSFLRSNDRLPVVLRLAGLDDPRFAEYVRRKALPQP